MQKNHKNLYPKGFRKKYFSLAAILALNSALLAQSQNTAILENWQKKSIMIKAVNVDINFGYNGGKKKMKKASKVAAKVTAKKKGTALLSMGHFMDVST